MTVQTLRQPLVDNFFKELVLSARAYFSSKNDNETVEESLATKRQQLCRGLPQSLRQRKDIGLDEPFHDARNEAINMATRNGQFF